MVLKPLEFSECLADSPWFRSNLHNHEYALEEASKKIRGVEQQCRKIITYTLKLSQAQKNFAQTLLDFKLASVGATQTDDEHAIAVSVNEFGRLVQQIEEQRLKVVEEAEKHYLDPLQQLADRIGRVTREERHKYTKESNKFYASLEKHLHLSTQRQKVDFREADAQLNIQQRSFCQASLQYVAEVQSIQERLKFEFVENLSAFLYRWLSFYHIGYRIHEDFSEVYDDINAKVQKAKESFEATQAEAEELKRRMLIAYFRSAVLPPGSNLQLSNANSLPDFALRPFNSNIKQGYLYALEKSLLPKTISRDVLSRSTWNKYYCVYSKETRIFTMIPSSSSHSAKGDMKGTLEHAIAFKLKSCVRRASDSIDKRFCFDVVPEEREGVMTLQALSEEDRRQWLDAMDGREPVYSPGVGPPSAHSNLFDTMLDETGFDFIRQCIRAIEERGIREQGLYRNCGVTSKVQKLMQMALDKRKTTHSDGKSPDLKTKQTASHLNLMDDSEWETRTISSAIKTYLRNLPEPLMTFDLHNHFINAAKIGDAEQRLKHIHCYVYKLPEAHHKMLELIIRHLRRVADMAGDNLMSAGNLGVCFGPTLLRPKEETMAAIMDIKFCNVVVEVLITNCQHIFDSSPPQHMGLPCPPKPTHQHPEHSGLVAVMPPAVGGAGSQPIASALLDAAGAGVGLASPATSSIASKSATVSSSSIADSLGSGVAGISLVGAGGPSSHATSAIEAQKRPSDGVTISSPQRAVPVTTATTPDNRQTTPTRNLANRASIAVVQHHPQPTAAVPTLANNSNAQAAGVVMGNVRQRQPPPVPPPTTVPSSISSSVNSNGGGSIGASNKQPPGSGREIQPPASTSNLASQAPNPPYKTSTPPTSSYLSYSSPAGVGIAAATLPRSHHFNYSNSQTTTGLGNGTPTAQSPAKEIAPANSTHPVHSNSQTVAGSMQQSGSTNHRGTAKMNASIYAPPPYNPLASENLNYYTMAKKRLSICGSNFAMPMSCSLHGNLSSSVSTSPPSINNNNNIQSNAAEGYGHGGEEIAISRTLYPMLQDNPSLQSYQPNQQQPGFLPPRINPNSIYSSYVNPSVQYLPSRRVRTLYACVAGHETELTFEAGQIITNVYESREEGWLLGTLNGKTGLIPANYVEDLPGP